MNTEDSLFAAIASYHDYSVFLPPLERAVFTTLHKSDHGYKKLTSDGRPATNGTNYRLLTRCFFYLLPVLKVPYPDTTSVLAV